MKVDAPLADRGKKRYAPPKFKVFRRAREAIGALIDRVAPLGWGRRSQAESANLAREIVEYGQMNASGAKVVVIEVGEVAFRLREPARAVRQSLRLLEAEGMAERTNSKDHWKLTGKLTA